MLEKIKDPVLWFNRLVELYGLVNLKFEESVSDPGLYFVKFHGRTTTIILGSYHNDRLEGLILKRQGQLK